MTQLWLLIHLQEYYKNNKNRLTQSIIGKGEERLQKFLLFLKTDPLMLAIRETLTGTLSGRQNGRRAPGHPVARSCENRGRVSLAPGPLGIAGRTDGFMTLTG